MWRACIEFNICKANIFILLHRMTKSKFVLTHIKNQIFYICFRKSIRYLLFISIFSCNYVLVSYQCMTFHKIRDVNKNTIQLIIVIIIFNQFFFCLLLMLKLSLESILNFWIIHQNELSISFVFVKIFRFFETSFLIIEHSKLFAIFCNLDISIQLTTITFRQTFYRQNFHVNLKFHEIFVFVTFLKIEINNF